MHSGDDARPITIDRNGKCGEILTKPVPSELTQSAATESAFSVSELDNASMHNMTHWANSLHPERFVNRTYNCVVYEIENEGYSAFSVDAQGVNGEGETYEDALLELKDAIENQISSRLGGIYPDTSDCEFQNAAFRTLESEWKADGVVVLHKSDSTITIFPVEVSRRGDAKANKVIAIRAAW